MFQRKTFTLLPLALAAAAAAQPALAFEIAQADVKQVTPATIEVSSDGKNYVGTNVPQIQIRGKVQVRLGAGASGRVKTWSIWPKIKPVNIGIGYDAQFQQDKTTKSYDTAQRPDAVNTEVWMAMSHESTRNYAVTACQTRANQMRTAGKTDQEIFSADRAIPLELQAGLSYEFTGVPGQRHPVEPAQTVPTFVVLCKASAQGASGIAVGGGIPTNSPALLQEVSMSASAPIGPARCPAEVTTFMTFKTDASQPPGYVRYRVKSLSGKASAMMTVQFSASDRNGPHYVKTVPQSFMVGGPAATPAAGGPQVGSQASSELAGARPDSDGIVRGQGRPAGQSGLASGAAPTPPNVHKDTLWVDVETAQQGSVNKSGYAAYTVTCDVIPTGVGGNTPGGVSTGSRPSPDGHGNTAPSPVSPPVAPARGPAAEAQPAARPQPPARPAAPLGMTGNTHSLPAAASTARSAAATASQPRR